MMSLETFTKKNNCLRGAKLKDINLFNASFTEVIAGPEYNWDNYYSLNLHIFETNKELTFEHAWEKFEKQANATLIFADSIDSNDWFEPHPLPWYGKNIPFSEPLWEVTGNHYLWANTEIQKWAKLNI